MRSPRGSHVVTCAQTASSSPGEIQTAICLFSTVRYLGIEVDDALEISEQTEI